MQVWSECVSRVPQLSNYLARRSAVPFFHSDRGGLNGDHDAVLGVAMVDDDAISGVRHNRVMQCPVPSVARFLSRVRVSGYIVAGVDHGSGRRRKGLAAPARIRRILV